MDFLISATYTAAYKRVKIDYMMSGAHEFTVCGEVPDDELAQLIAAEGSDVAGWSCDLG